MGRVLVLLEERAFFKGLSTKEEGQQEAQEKAKA